MADTKKKTLSLTRADVHEMALECVKGISLAHSMFEEIIDDRENKEDAISEMSNVLNDLMKSVALFSSVIKHIGEGKFTTKTARIVEDDEDAASEATEAE